MGLAFPPADSYRLFLERLYPVLLQARPQLELCYCRANGRPAREPVLMLGITLLQFMEKLPDRQAMHMLKYHLGWKLALQQELGVEGLEEHASGVLSPTAYGIGSGQAAVRQRPAGSDPDRAGSPWRQETAGFHIGAGASGGSLGGRKAVPDNASGRGPFAERQADLAHLVRGSGGPLRSQPAGENWAVEVKTGAATEEELRGLRAFCGQYRQFEPCLVRLRESRPVPGVRELSVAEVLSLHRR